MFIGLFVFVWKRYDFAKTGVDEVVTTLHWHAHTVADLCFTTDGQSVIIVSSISC